jgi:hypothetical protein
MIIKKHMDQNNSLPISSDISLKKLSEDSYAFLKMS